MSKRITLSLVPIWRTRVIVIIQDEDAKRP